MDSQVPLLVKRTGNILTLSLNNINKRNALNTELMGAAAAALEFHGEPYLKYPRHQRWRDNGAEEDSGDETADEREGDA